MNNLTVEVDVAAESGLVLQQAGQSVLREVRVKNAGEETLVGARLVVSSDIGLFRPLEMALAAVQPGETVCVPIPEGEPRLDYAFLSELADVKEGEVRAAVQDADGNELAFASARQTAYPPDQTLGCGRPIYYASFVIPSCDATRRIQTDVAKILEETTGSAAIVGYLQGKAAVYDICKAVYRAVQNLGISYAVAPATFGQPGQKVRLPDEILKYKTGCCLDTTLLFASMFELCGLRPVVVLIENHAFVGCHLLDKSFHDPVVTDAETLRKAMDDDIRARALVRALETLKAEQDISRRDLLIYVCRRSEGVPSKVVAEKFNLTANNVDVITWRVGQLVRKHGPRHFEEALRHVGYGYAA